jgi:transketolase C-terminal domain/subunit
VLGPIQLSGTADAVSARFFDAEVQSLGTAVRITSYAGNVAAIRAALGVAARAADLLSGTVVTIEDHFETGGVWSIVAEILARDSVHTRTVSISCGDRWFTPALLPDALNSAGFTAEAIADRIRAECAELTSF